MNTLRTYLSRICRPTTYNNKNRQESIQPSTYISRFFREFLGMGNNESAEFIGIDASCLSRWANPEAHAASSTGYELSYRAFREIVEGRTFPKHCAVGHLSISRYQMLAKKAQHRESAKLLLYAHYRLTKQWNEIYEAPAGTTYTLAELHKSTDSWFTLKNGTSLEVWEGEALMPGGYLRACKILGLREADEDEDLQAPHAREESKEIVGEPMSVDQPKTEEPSVIVQPDAGVPSEVEAKAALLEALAERKVPPKELVRLALQSKEILRLMEVMGKEAVSSGLLNDSLVEALRKLYCAWDSQVVDALSHTLEVSEERKALLEGAAALRATLDLEL